MSSRRGREFAAFARLGVHHTDAEAHERGLLELGRNSQVSQKNGDV